MVRVIFSDGGITYNRNAFYQYDYGRHLEIIGLNLPDGTQFHFANKGGTALTQISTTAEGKTTVLVPQKVLEKSGELNVYIYSTNETSGITIKTITFNVRAREKPGDYAPPDEPNIIEQLQSKLDQIIATGIASYVPDQEAVNEMIQEYVPENLITNNDVATVPGTAWDAVRGKAIRDDLNEVSQLIDQKLNNPQYIQDIINTYFKANLVTNNDAATVPGTAWDAVRGKAIRDDLNAINNKLAHRTIEAKMAAAKYGNDYFCTYSFPIRMSETPIITIISYFIDGETATSCSTFLVTPDFVQFKLAISSTGSYNPALVTITFSY